MLSNMRIRTKLLGLIVILAAIIVSISVISVQRLTGANASLTEVELMGDIQTTGARMNQNLIILNRAEYRMAADPTAETIASASKVRADNSALFEERFDKVMKLANPEEAGMLRAIRTDYDNYMALSNTIAARAGEVGKAATFTEGQRELNSTIKESRALVDKLQTSVKNYVDHMGNKAQSISLEANAAGESAVTLLISVAVAGVVAGVAFGYLLATYGISRPLNRSVRELEKLASGDLAVEITGASRRDECGDIARGLEVFRRNGLRNRELEADAEAQKHRSEQERKTAMRDMADQFERAVGGIVDMVSSASTEMQATAQQLTASAQETSAQSVAVSAAAEEAAANVASVADSADELGRSVDEVGRQMERSSKLAQEAVNEAGMTAEIVAELTQGATRIGDIVELIAGIAAQTNLLALNATIEAARAGEAGRGFAVVASEVKNLAEQTSKATGEISAQISNIQSITGRAVSAIGGITNTIRTINESATSIAHSVEEQGAATREIVQSVNQASSGTNEVTANISGVARAAEETGGGASQVLSAASELAEQAERLRTEVSTFLSTVRAA